MKIVLASSSPRRISLLSGMNVEFEIRRPDVDEEFFEDPVKTVEFNALKKARAVRKGREIVLGFDTIVFLDGEILGKPQNENHAYRLLKKLSGKVHRVYTGIAVVTPEREIVDHEVSEVKFRPLTDREIWEYIRTGEPLDKAGAYGCQEKGRALVEYVNGSETNVIGLPIEKLKKLLEKIGVCDIFRRRNHG
ncbi:MAG TPA: septum formation protein Maf [candidate division WOR-3 bacterium]|uniref:dTTP/UTP pyrophosphatase n=1 Tax=candidate division WOR-3 bacterium TaxID=2052148 RepID=A0A7C0VBK6_UNCW3|nr:septum formation protein Maf [candidate division WOR-3 bacterium]